MTSKFKLSLTSSTLALALSVAFAGAASAADLQSQVDSLQKQIDALKAQSAAAPASSGLPFANDGTLTLYGVTLYGVVDSGVSYQSHGAGYNPYSTTNVAEIISKQSNGAQWNATPNGMSQSRFGLKGTEEVIPGALSVVFKLEGGFNPVSGVLADGPHSLAMNDNASSSKPYIGYTTSADSGQAGEIFNRAAYVGVSNPLAGTVTFGRNTGVMYDATIAADPWGGSTAFSYIGNSGGYATGAGNTEQNRFDDSIKYNVKYGPVRVAALYQFAGTSTTVGGDTAMQGGLGLDYAGATLDYIWSQKKDALALASDNTAGATDLKATVSDNTAWAVTSTYKVNTVKLFAGYEHMVVADAKNGENGTGELAYTNIANFTTYALNSTLTTATGGASKVYQAIWTGVTYNATSKLDLTAAYYLRTQNNYKDGQGKKCDQSDSATNDSSCGGMVQAVSVGGDYKFSKRFDSYAGVTWSRAEGGLASGFIHNSAVSPMVGVRFQF